MAPIQLSELSIRTKDRQLIPFSPNEVQAQYLDILTDTYEGFDWRAGACTLRGAREDVLKARQEGMSTLWLLLFFADTINTALTQTIIIADNAERAEMLFKICHRAWDHLPRDRQPRKKYSSKRELEFTDLDSVIYVGTAGQVSVGRGGTINNVLMSERAYWANGDEVEAGLMESVPPFGNVVRETTANGLNEYYELRQREHEGQSVFRPRFFGWSLHREYRAPVQADFVPDEAELLLKREYRLEDEQLAWRRDKVLQLKDKFGQEYPLVEADAFLASGHPYFDRARLLAIAAETRHRQPLLGLSFDREYLPLLYHSYQEGQVLFYQMPGDGAEYLITADTAEGEDPTKGDYDAAGVYDLWTRRRMASLHGRWDTQLYGELLTELGLLYNTALLVVERNNHGWAVLQAIRQTSYPQQRGLGAHGLYHHNPLALQDGFGPSPDSWKPGWPTLSDTKTFALDRLRTCVEESEEDPGMAAMFDGALVEECLRFVHLPAGRAGAEGTAHDDRVMEAAIAAGIFTLRWRMKQTPTLRPPTDDGRRYARTLRR